MSRCGGVPVMPQSQIFSSANASAVLNEEPTLFKLRISSNNKHICVFCFDLKWRPLRRPFILNESKKRIRRGELHSPTITEEKQELKQCR